MILVDTAVWIDHFRRANPTLRVALEENTVGVHPFVLGELRLGGARPAVRPLALLPQVQPAAHDEVLAFIDRHALSGSGIGWVDVHLLCAAHLAGWDLWTSDRRLAALARRFAPDPH